MTELKKFLWYLMPFAFRSLIPLIALPIFTSFLSTDDFGLYALSIFFGTFLSGFANLGLLIVYERNFFAEKEIKYAINLLFTNVNFVLITLSILTFTSWVFIDLIATFFFNNTEISELLILGLLYCGIKSLNEYFYMYFKNRENAKRFSQISIFESILSVSASLFLVVSLSMGIKGFVYGQLFSVLSIFIFLYVYLYVKYKPLFIFLELKKALGLGLPLTPRMFLGVIGQQFDRYMLGYIGNLSGTGIYDVGLKIANVGNSFSTTLKQVFSPTVYKSLFSDDEERLNKIGKYLTPFFYLSVLVSLITCLFSYEIVALLTPKDFHDASLIISILSILNVFYFFGKQGQLIFAKKSFLISVLSFGTIVFNILLNIPMILYYGVFGAAWATLISGVMSSIASFYFAQKYTPIVWENKIIYYLMYIILSFIFILILDMYEISYLTKLFFKFLILIVYVYIGYRNNMLKSLTKLKLFRKFN